MSEFVILADSTSDLTKDVREKYDIDYVAMNYVIDGTEYVASLDWETHSAKEFYDFMRNGKRATTTQVPREAFVEKFTQYLKMGKDILYIACSSALSGSVNLARVISNELAEEYRDNKIVCVDSLRCSLAQGYMAIRASELRKENKTIDEVAQYLEDNKLKFNMFGTVENLDYLRRAGRVKASSAFFGNMFGIKPIIISDVIGQNYANEKVKGAVNSKIKIAQHIAETVEDAGKALLCITHADCIEDAELLRDKILELVEFEDVMINNIGPIVGSCTGPGTVVAFCFGKEVTVKGSE